MLLSITKNKNKSPTQMTSLTAHTIVGDLSPEQRQALFDKLRQRKLAQARKPVEMAVVTALPHQLAWSPLQKACTAPRFNRVLEIQLAGAPDLARLGNTLQQLLQHHDGLHLRNAGSEPHFLTATAAAPWQSHPLGTRVSLTQLRDELAILQPASACVQAAAITPSADTTHLLLAAHPLLLDHYSLLGLAHQWLSLYADNLNLDQLQRTSVERQNHFSQWSAQVLEHKFLNQEWNRLKPRRQNTTPAAERPGNAPDCARLELTADFIDQHMPAGEWRKSWLLDATHRCLSHWLAHQDIHYWIEAPGLRGEAFEAQLGYFPYYLPVSRTQNDDNATLTTALRLQRLQTRYTSVTEQLATDLCRQGASAPLIHYHWFDLDTAPSHPLEVRALHVQQPGLMLAPVEIHMIERLDGISLDVHFQPDHLGRDQVDQLLQNLLDLLRQGKNTPASTPPSLQERLRQIWKDLLHKPDIDDGQSFFELGGHSLQVTELKFRIKQHLKLDIPISVLYELSTINKLANFILATHGNALGFSTANAAEDEEEGTL